MTDLIASRSPRDLDFGRVSWMVAVDSRGLDVRDCGCGEIVRERSVRTRPQRPANPSVIEVCFFHDYMKRCEMAFDYKDFTPLTYGAYCKLLGIDSDYEADEDD